jgi:hypothetical protein
MLKRILIVTALLLMGATCLFPQQAPAGRVLNDAFVTHPFRHHIWQEVLMQNVGPDGAVDFAHLLVYPRRLNEYLDQLAAASPENDPKAFPTHNDQTAYWINAHNAIALRLIINHYPIQSIRQVTDLETNTHYTLGGVGYNLSQIRAKALRFDSSPAIAFTMTDYSAGAPPLLARAYEGKELKALSLQARKNTLSSPTLIRFQRKGNGCVSTQLSPYFKGLEASLFSIDQQAADEDRDQLDDTPPALPDKPMNWHDWLRPLTSGKLYRDLGNPTCPSKIEFLPPAPNLRQVQLLRS